MVGPSTFLPMMSLHAGREVTLDTLQRVPDLADLTGIDRGQRLPDPSGDAGARDADFVFYVCKCFRIVSGQKYTAVRA